MAKTKEERAAQHREWKRRNPERWKAIQKKSADKYKEKNRERIRAAAKARYDADPAANLASSRRYYKKNRPRLLARAKARNKKRYAEDPVYRQRLIQNAKDWSAAHPGAVSARCAAWKKARPGYQWQYTKQRLLTDPEFAIAHRVRNRISAALRRGVKGKKSAKSIELLGCTIEFYMPYLEERFTPGMTWANRKLWHIDHIIPLAAFDLTDPEQQKAAFHFTNTQPLWKPDNLRKGDRIAA